jgi:transcriptional regulator with XRE-family HTH domain
MDITQRVALRIRRQRTRRAWSLDELAARSGVSRAMISKIEREAVRPSAALLDRLADALGVTLSSLIAEEGTTGAALRRRDEQSVWEDPKSGYTRRHVSPAGTDSDIEIVAVELPPAARVVFAAASHHRHDQQVLVLQGCLSVGLARRQMHLQPGDCARVRVDMRHEFFNPGPRPARYLVVTRLGGQRVATPG